MKTDLIQSIGIIIVLIGVVILALPGFGIAGSLNDNVWTGGGLLTIVIGIIVHIAVNKKIQN